jgi:diacylglycerol kinase family enzyme
VFRKFPYYDIKLNLKEGSHQLKTPLLFMGNGRYDYDGIDIGKRENISDGLLTLYVLKDATRLELLKLSIKALIRSIHKDPKFERHYIKEAEICLPRPYIYVAKDGEILKLKSPLRYEILPKSLKVILPQ